MAMNSVSKYTDEIYKFLLTHKQASAACAASGAVIAAIWWWNGANKNLPPGPRFLLLGKFFRPNSEEEMRRNCVKLREEYGDIVSSRLFTNVFVILNSYEAIKEAYVVNGDCLSGRPQIKFGSRLDDESAPGLLNAEGLIWQEHRRFVLSSLRDFGFGKNTTESMIREEVQQLYRFFEEEGRGGTQAVEPSLVFAKASTNVICSLVFGQRCGTDKDLEEVFDMFRRGRESNPSLIAFLLARLLKFLPGDLFKLKETLNCIDRVLLYVDEKIKAHRVKHTEGNDGDLIDAYLTAQLQQERENPGKHFFTDFQLTRIIFDLFMAGTDTIAIMMRWLIYEMALHQDLQEKVQQELDEVIGQRMPSVSDRIKLKYTDAVLHELQRFVVMLPLGGPLHRVTNDVYVRGYRLPKNASAAANLYAVFRDPKLWPYPDELNVGNFYDEKTNTLKNTEYLIPFMIGRRACPGESLAKQEVFLFFVSLLQRFKFSLDDTKITKIPFNTFVNLPPPYKVYAKSRI